jgi:putative membrane protein
MDNDIKTYGSGEKMILRDYLALDRTKLANERTFLAYVRMSIGLVAAGAGLVGILDMTWSTIIGWVMLISAPAALVAGILRYIRVRGKLKRLDA